MNATQEASLRQPYGQTGDPWAGYSSPPLQPTDYRFPIHASRGSSIGWEIAGLAALALVVVGGIYIWPDVQRYMKIRNM